MSSQQNASGDEIPHVDMCFQLWEYIYGDFKES